MDVNALDAAKSQLGTAIQLYFEDRDPISVHTLVSAAGELINRACAARGLMTFRADLLNRGAIVGKRKEISDALNQARNFFKHAEPDAILANFSDDHNFFGIVFAEYGLRLLGETLPETKVFLGWVMAVEPKLFQTPPPQSYVHSIFGDIAEQSRAEQKKVAHDAIHLILTGKLPP
jgi:hypothetical protein